MICFHAQDKLVEREVRLATAMKSLNNEEITLDEKQKDLNEVQANYDVLMQQRQVRMKQLLTLFPTVVHSITVVGSVVSSNNRFSCILKSIDVTNSP